ncbi:MAG: transposase [Treponemataceae bacterium]
MYKVYVKRMQKAESAEARRAVVDDMCKMFSFSTAKAYKELKANGWDSGRRKRKDAGTSRMSEEDLKLVAALLRKGLRKNGKATMSVPLARSILKSNGFNITIGESRLRELLVENNLSLAEARKPSPHNRMRSLYPNHVHQVDPSMSLIWFAPSGSQKIFDDDEVYKNKNPLEGKLKCWRYVLTDHTSGSICVKYYAAMGESAVNMYDFLLYAWGQKKNPLYVFHGLPSLLVWDCGTGNTAKAVTAALTALNVETKPHLPGNPRAKGQVETSNDIVETQFESRLLLEPVHSIEELNEAVERWCAAFNANMLEYLDTRISRRGKKIGSRTKLWQHITEDQLRELPEPEICRQIFTSGIQTRRVAGDLSISIVHPMVKESLRYSLHGLTGILVGQTVNVQPILVTDEPIVKVAYKYLGETMSYEIKPIEYDEFGFDVNAAVIGQNYKAAGETAREKTAKELEEMSEGTKERPFTKITGGTGLTAHSNIDAKSMFIQQQTGTQVAINTVTVHDILISGAEMAKRIRARLGYVPTGFIDRMKAEFNNAVPSNLIDDFVAEYSNAAQAQLG